MGQSWPLFVDFCLFTLNNFLINWWKHRWCAWDTYPGQQDGRHQCDQIGQFIGIWAGFQSLWQQLNCPNLTHSLSIFVKVSKLFIFLVKPFLGNFYGHMAIFIWSHWKAQTNPLRYGGTPSVKQILKTLFALQNKLRRWKCLALNTIN